MTRVKYPIGSVSSGTMRTEDLIDSFAVELRYQMGRVRMSRDQRKRHGALYRECVALGTGDAGSDEYETDEAREILSELFDALDCYSAPYFYFGAHDGDGADYGYWLSSSFVEDFDGLKVDDTSKVPASYRGEVLQVSDHGNLTLYVKTARTMREIWGIV
jgi:hypothetical protein